MNRVSQLLATGTILVFAFLGVAPKVLAFETLQPACQDASGSKVCQDSDQQTDPIAGPNGILTKAVSLLSFVIGVAAVIMIIIGGIRFIISGGDATKVATAKSTILYAVIGLAVAAMARAIVIFVLNKL